jgi:hypothetical protein
MEVQEIRSKLGADLSKPHFFSLFMPSTFATVRPFNLLMKLRPVTFRYKAQRRLSALETRLPHPVPTAGLPARPPL